MKAAIPLSESQAHSGSNSGRSKGRPCTLVKICTALAPRSFTARSASATPASGSAIGIEAMKAGNRSGCAATSSAWASLPIRPSSSAFAGPASISSGGEASDRIWR